MTPQEFSEQHRIVYYETDPNDRLTLPMLLNIIILASEDQNQHLKLNPRSPSSLGRGWVVVQYSIKINRLPRNDEKVWVSTVSPCYNSLFADRRFEILDSQKNVLVSVKSRWVVLDLKTRELSIITPKQVKPYGSQKVGVIPSLLRPKEIQGSNVKSHEYRVRYSDIDINHHVNNSRYLDWMTDVLTPRFLTEYRPGRIDLKFRNEVKYGDVIKSCVQKQVIKSGQLLTRHEIYSHGRLTTVANIIWQK